MQSDFTKLLLQWNKLYNNRTMPWKGEKDPYKIWLAEIILQQTRVEQGLPYYNNFITKYPTIINLANASDDEVFKLWEGLGYYSRCKNLLFTARNVRDDYNGIFPSDYHQIISLKGVGLYTAAAIASFAFNLPYAVVDGNVYRVLARFYNESTPIDSIEGKKHFGNLAQQLLPATQASIYNQAIMDFGATVCTPKNPLCTICNLKTNCKAYARNTVTKLPVKQKKIKKTDRFLYFFILKCKGAIYIEKRVSKDIWQNLHQFFLIEKDEPQQLNIANAQKLISAVLLDNSMVISNISSIYKQTLTHQKIEGCFIEVILKTKLTILEKSGFWVNEKDLKNYAFPKFLNQFLKQ